MRILCPRKPSRLNLDCTQTPLPAGSTIPSPQVKVCTTPVPPALPQWLKARELKHIVSCTPRGAGGRVPVSVTVSSQDLPPKVLQARTVFRYTFSNGTSVSQTPQSSIAGLPLRSTCAWTNAQSWQRLTPPLTALPSTRSVMCQNDSFRSFSSRGMIAMLIGLEMNACRVRRWVESPTAANPGSKWAPMCMEFGGEKAFWSSAGGAYEQPPTQAAPWAPKPPLSVFGQLPAPGAQWKCQSIG